ncbi:ejaculatory bulb-specific protein 3 [Aethina tumida]|uniref:ejaculatory bulb-specific protein 3 n=1 Tax=Aethina tumida TaxID=116153 RepID=UPI00096B383F|nr:ejaculatory bulb-specific protein 3 [Aethina tumida]
MVRKTVTMRIAIVFLIVVLAVISRAEEKYTSKYDNVDLDSIFKSERLLSNYVNCLMDRGRCTPDGMELKTYLPDALQNDCSKCSQDQIEKGRKVVDFMMKNKPDMWKELEAKYDPEGVYRKKYQDRLKESS